MIGRDDIIDIGRYNKQHGVHGEISASLDVDIDLLREFSCLVSDIDGIFVPFFVEALRSKGSSTALLTIDGIDNENQASLLVNKDIYVLKCEYEQLSYDENSDEMPLDYFIGYTIVMQQGVKVGEVVDVDDSTENVLFIVDHDGAEVAIPAVDELIVDINTHNKIIEMSLPQGLLEL